MAKVPGGAVRVIQESVLVAPVIVDSKFINTNHVGIVCVVNEKYRTLVFDTGSPVSFIKSSGIPIELTDPWDEENIKMVNLTTLKTKGTVDLETRVSLLDIHRWKTVRYHLVDNLPFEGILGLDAITMFGITVTINQGNIGFKFTEDEPRVRISALSKFINLLTTDEEWSPFAFLLAIAETSSKMDRQQQNHSARYTYNNERHYNFHYQDLVEFTDMTTKIRGLYLIGMPTGLEFYKLHRVRDNKIIEARMNEIIKVDGFQKSLQQQRRFLARYNTTPYDPPSSTNNEEFTTSDWGMLEDD